MMYSLLSTEKKDNFEVYLFFKAGFHTVYCTLAFTVLQHMYAHKLSKQAQTVSYITNGTYCCHTLNSSAHTMKGFPTLIWIL